MKAVVTRENFKKVLSLVGHIVGNTATLPILSNILLQSDKGRLKISATNLEVGLTAWMGGRVEEEGSLTLPAKTIGEYMGTTLGEQVELSTDKNQLIIATDTSSATIKTLPPEEFPLIPQVTPSGKITLPAEKLKKALTEVVFAAAPMETQPELAGVYIYADSAKLFFVATDRYRLTESTLPVAEASLEGDFKPVLMPARTVQETIRLLSAAPAEAKAEITQGENQILVKLPDIELVSRLVDSQFPDYKQIIPKEFLSEATVPRYELLQAIKSAGLFAENHRSVRLSFKPTANAIEVFAASGDIGESKVTVPGELTGQEQINTFNFRYLQDYLTNSQDEKVVFKLINDNSPAVIYPKGRDNSLYLVMPIKS